MHKFGRYLFYIFLIWLPLVTRSQAQPQIEPDLLQEDLLIFRDIILETSPRLSEEEKTSINQLIDQRLDIIRPMSVIRFTEFLADLDIQSGFDEHASLELEEDVLMPLLAESQLFPIPIHILDNEVVVNTTTTEIPYGSRIYSLNGTPIDSVMFSLTDDYDTFSKRNLEKQFSLLYLIKYGEMEFYNISYAAPDAPDAVTHLKIPGVDVGSWVRIMNEESVYPLDRESLRKLFTTQYNPDTKTFYLQLNSFNWDKRENKGLLGMFAGEYKQFDKVFKEIFTDIKKQGASNLILDLRYNSGGNLLIPGLLYSYLAVSPFSEKIVIKAPDFNLPQEAHLARLDGEPLKSNKDINKFIGRYESKFTPSEPGYSWNFLTKTDVPPQENAFNGAVYVLIGGRSISASSYFTALFLSQQRGVVAGETIGGSHHSLTAGTSVTYSLPNSGIIVTVPLMEIIFSDELYQAVPEYKINPEITIAPEDRYRYFLDKQDPEIEEVLKIISLEQ